MEQVEGLVRIGAQRNRLIKMLIARLVRRPPQCLLEVQPRSPRGESSARLYIRAFKPFNPFSRFSVFSFFPPPLSTSRTILFIARWPMCVRVCAKSGLYVTLGFRRSKNANHVCAMTCFNTIKPGYLNFLESRDEIYM